MSHDRPASSPDRRLMWTPSLERSQATNLARFAERVGQSGEDVGAEPATDAGQAAGVNRRYANSPLQFPDDSPALVGQAGIEAFEAERELQVVQTEQV